MMTETSGSDKTSRNPKAKKIRIDQLLLDRGLVASKSKAQALIMAGKVFGGEEKITKPGHRVAENKALEIRGQDHPWVSRGGVKLDKAIRYFDLDVKNRICIDIGCSTGGFTDVLLENGARKVYAVDVGRGQLSWKLRHDERVIVMENTNARYLDKEDIPDAIDAVVCDASFIGLEKILPASMALTGGGAFLVALIKPQFQVAKGAVGKGGVIRDPMLHQNVCAEIHRWLASLEGWQVAGITESPITGAKGNIEFLVCAHKIRP